ncbi:MAG: mucin-binding protein, partial [Limosilactobacillus pontis]
MNRDDLTKTVTETIHYEGAGEQTPAAKTAKLFFNGTAYYDSVTKKCTYASGNELKDQTENVTWIAQSGNQFATVVTPTINGYTSKVQEGYDDGQGNVKEIPGIDQNSK